MQVCEYTHMVADMDQQSEIQALQLFIKLGTQDDQIAQLQKLRRQLNQQINNLPQSEEQQPQHHKKSKKQKKKEKKKQKRRLKKLHKLNHKDEGITPKKKIKNNDGSSQQNNHYRNDAGSSQYSSQNQSNMQSQLKQLNPHHRKRLQKSSAKSRHEDKQGFKLQQLGNDANISIDEDDSQYSQKLKKKCKKQLKIKKNIISTQQALNELKQNGAINSDDQVGNEPYDTGLSAFLAMKYKKKPNTVRSTNRMFQIQVEFKQDQEKKQQQKQLKLQLKPKSSGSSDRFTFMKKAQNIKKQRGLQADIDQQQYEKRQQQKAKKSILKIISTMSNEVYHDDLQIQIKVPQVARGKSADIINNTVFLKRIISKPQTRKQEDGIQILNLNQSKSWSNNQISIKKQIVNRAALFKQIQSQTRIRRSKYISQQQIKNSFKKTNLQQLEEARLKIQQKRLKEQGEIEEQQNQQQVLDEKQQKIIELIHKQQQYCVGNVQEQEQNQQQQIKQIAQNEQNKDIEEKQNKQDKNIQEQVLNEQLGQYNQLLNQLDAVSSKRNDNQSQNQQQSIKQDQEDLQQQNQEIQQNEQQQQINHQSQHVSNNQIRQKQIQQLQEQGIFIKKNKSKFKSQNPYIHNQLQQIKRYSVDQQNVIIQQNQNIQSQFNHQQQFVILKKLKNQAKQKQRKVKQKQQNKKFASQYIQNQAQQGSDNQDHDDVVKKVNDEDQQNEELDKDDSELINNQVNQNSQDQEQAYRKFNEDIRMKDRQQIQKIIRGQFKQKHANLDLQIEEDEKKRLQRMQQVMQWMKKREQQQGAGLYANDQKQNQNDSDQDSQQRYDKKKQQQQQKAKQQNKISRQQEIARLQKYFQNTLPSMKKQILPIYEYNQIQLPQSVKIQKKMPGSKTIGASKLANRSKIQLKKTDSNKTSSLINQILNKKPYKPANKLVNLQIKKTKK